MKKRILALVMSCALFASMLPATVLADVEENAEAQTEEADAIEEAESDEDADAIEEDADALAEAESDEDALVDAEDADEETSLEEETEEDADAEYVTYKEEADGVIVTVTAPGDALPEGAELSVERYAESSADYKDAAEAIDYEADDESGMAAVDISFLLDGEEVEPTEPVQVRMDVSEILPADADASSLEVQHLEEDGSAVKPIVVANDSAKTAGTIDEENATAEFEVDSFSSFTVTWTFSGGPVAGTTYSLSVTAYLDGVELNDISGLTFSSENDELDFETLLSDVDYGTGDYTFSYAIVTVGNQTYGSQDNPVVAIEIDQGTGGPTASSNFLLVYADGRTGTVATSSTVSVSAYYLTPDFSVSIEAVDEDESTEAWALQAVLSHAGSYESISYEWTVTDSDGSTSQYAKVTNTDNTGRAYIAWEEDTPDNTEVTVTVTVTLTLEDGETKTATANYVLEYGDETVDLIMTYGPDKTALPAGVTVTLTSESGEHVYTGTTDSDGWVHDLEIEPGIYTVTATYTDSEGNTYQCSETVAMHDAGNYYINLNYYDEEILTSVPERSNWEHIDIKLSVGTSSNSDSGSVSVNITGAQIIGSDGTVKYTATEDTIEGNDNEFQLSFYEGDGSTGTADHSISFDTGDTINITYILTVDGVVQDPVTISITASTTYDEGTTYPITGQRAYKLYNYLYGTSYSSDAQLIADGIDDIDISGMSMMLVAAILCDSSEVTGAGQVQAVEGQSANQWGMDFALSIEAMNELAASWAFNIEKTYENASMTAGDFVFYLYNATVEDGTWSLGDLQSTLTNQTAGMDWDGNSYDTMELFSIAYSDEAIQNGETYYYILYEEPDTVSSSSGATITFDGTIFGAMVQLGTDEETGEATVTATYYRLEKEGDTYTIAETYTTGTSVDGKITFDQDGSNYATYEFTNNYQEYVDISGTKVWDDNNDAAGKRPESITITLLKNGSVALDDEGNPITITVTASDEDPDRNTWNWSFEDLPVWDGITKNTYSISEEITVDGYEVEITQNEETGEYTITNSFTAVASAEIEATKNYVNSTGADMTTWPQGGFTFTLSPVGSEEDVPMPVNTTVTATQGDPDVGFGEITYTEEGTYYYQITESHVEADYITDDAYYHYAKVVVVTDSDTGELTATVSYLTSEEEITDFTDDDYTWSSSETGTTFTNTYEATGSVTLAATKKYTGAELTEGLFAFTITETTVGVDEDNLYSGTGTNDAEGNITFTPDLTYKLSDVGTHTYTVSEDIPEGATSNNDGTYNLNGVTYDGSQFTVSVLVEDAGDGTLTTTVYVNGNLLTTEEEDGSYNIGTFENSYEATGSVTFGGTKTISGTTSTNQTFEFALYTTDSDFAVAEDATATDTQTVTGTGSFTFGTISYDSDTEGNGEGTYYYVVKETSTDGNGWTMDTNEYHITVIVTDEGDGTFTLEVTCVDAEGEEVALTQADDGSYSFTGLDFANSYEAAETSVQFTGTKYLTNSESTDKVFTFELYNADSSFVTDGDAIQTKTTTGADTITFDKITYTEAGTYYYVIQEKALDPTEGWTIDSNIYNITVEVTDDGLGQLVATVTVNGTEVTGTENVYGGFDFTNAYEAKGDVTLGVVKSISGVASTDEEFEFTLYESDENFATGDLIETITTDGEITDSTKLNFTEITYTAAGTYYYVIKETGSAPDGWTLDAKEYHVTVTATDNGDGTITTSVAYEYVDENEETQTENSAAFINTYAATGELSLTGTKTFEGGTLEKDGFTFTMTDSTGASVGDVTMDEEGNITFPTLTYDETDIGGEYTYTITEVSGTDSSVQYDETSYTVVVSVADNGDGTLDVTYTVNGTESGDISFTNYQLGSLTITKTFTGLTNEQIAGLTDFTIIVTNSDGDTVATLTLDNADEDSAYAWTVSNLPADTYTVTETGYSVDGYEVIVKSGEATVTNGSVSDVLSWGDEDTVALDNDYTEVGSLSISKHVVESSTASHLGVGYTVVITADGDVDLQWVKVTDSTGATINCTVEGKTITFTIIDGQEVTVSGLPLGKYTVEETVAEQDDFEPVYRVGESETETAPTVEVSSDTETAVTVEIDNEYSIDTYIQVQKNYNSTTYPTGENAFTFTIEALSCDLDAGTTLTVDEMPMPSYTSVTVTDDNPVTFGQMTFEHFGTYYYKIRETTGSLDYIDYDSSVYYVKVVVSYNEETYEETIVESYCKADEGTEDYEGLPYTEATTIVTAEFTNTYSAESKVTFGGEKTIKGIESTGQTFEFALYTTDSDFTVAEGATATDTQTVTGKGSFTFEAISYDSDTEGNGEGTYYYVVKETSTDGNGWTMDTNEYHITVVVTDANDGTFKLEVTCVNTDGETVSLTQAGDGSYSFTGLDFENTYKAEETSVQFEGTKYITNSTSTEKVFTFELYTTDSSFSTDGLTPAQTSTEGEITSEGQVFQFDKITYTEAGTYYYVIQEQALDAAEGWTIDSKVYNITVVVTDDGLGQLVATVTVDDGTAVDDEDGIYGGFDFTNGYAAEGDVTLGVVKSISGTTSTEATFSFTLYNSDENFVTGDSIETITTEGTIENSTALNFTAINYTEAGTYYYVIKETGDTLDGWTLDEKEYHVTVTATDNGDGTITTSVSYEYVDENEETQTENSAAFTNAYEATGSVTFGGEKTIEGIESTEQTFEFALYTTDDTFAVGEDAEATDTKTVTGAGSFTFETISYDSATENGAGIYYYVVKETSTDENGWTIDTNEYQITVVVTDAGNGTFTLAVTCVNADGDTVTLTQADDGSYSFTGLDFTNEYEPAPTSVQFTGTKYITNSTSTEKVFTFELYTTESDFSIEDLTPVQTSTEGEITSEGKSFEFDEITYTEAGTYYYVIQEKALETAEGWTIDSKVYNITVEVTDDGLGQLVATVTVDETEVAGTEDVYGGFDFTNAYAAEGDVTLGVVKSISGVASTDEKFEFTLYNSDENFATGDSIETITTDGEITNSTALNFDKISYTAAGTYYYVIKETGTAPDGWTLDEKEYHVTVTATDNGDGTITTTVSYEYVDENEETQTENSAAFTNTYDASGDVTLTATKKFVGADLTEGQFEFTITETTEGVEEEDLYTGTGTNDAEGNITFTPEITYKLSDVGTHTYEIAETEGTAGGVTYDSNKITVTVDVTDNGDGTLSTKVTVDDNEIEATDDAYNVGTFSNSYEAKGSVTLTATKVLAGSELSEGQFTFTITETSLGGTYTGTGTNDAEGNITFTPAIEYELSDVGDHTYVIKEDIPEDAVERADGMYVYDGVAYDPSEITVTVTVTDNGDGTLATAVTLDGDGLTAGDDGSYNVGTFTNKAVTEISGQKFWDDNDDEYKNRPDSITLKLYRKAGDGDGTYVQDITVTAGEDGAWKWTVTGLDKFDESGEEYTYYIDEVAVDGYTTVVEENGLDVTNTTEVITLSGEKVWDDDDNNDNVRPDGITVYIVSGTTIVQVITVTPDANGDWSWTSDELPKYENGEEINYRVIEAHIDGYTTTYDTDEETGNYIITNTHTDDKTGLTVYKDWADNDNQDGKRPDSIEVQLTATYTGDNGEEVTEEIDEATLDDNNNWTHTFTDLNVYKDGEEIEYSIEEVSVDEYDTHITRVNGTNVIVIVNEYHPKTTDIEVQKFWEDNNDQDGVRPDYIDVTMTGTYTDDDGNLAEIESVTNRITADTDWTTEFFELPIYAHHGHKIKYSISEVDVDEYECTASALEEQDDGTYLIKITNEHETETVDIEGTKVWVDDDNAGLTRPDSITVNLFADGVYITSTTVSMAEEDAANPLTMGTPVFLADDTNTWSWSFKDLPKYRDGGVEIEYTVTEDIEGSYLPTITQNDDGSFTITNTLTSTTEATVTKEWVDNENAYNTRPNDISVQLLADEEAYGDAVTLNEGNNWTYTWTDLPQYDSDGKEITYTADEIDEIDDYETTYSEDGFTITNTLTGETEATVTKAWVDNDNAYNTRPNEISVQLLADNEAYGDAVTLNERNDWTYTWTELPKYDSTGKEITYKAAEIAEVENYETTYSEDGLTITNTLTGETEITVNKTWVDNDNAYETRPASITVAITGSDENTYTLILNDGNSWSATQSNLPLYDSTGAEITYTVSEEAVNGYTGEVVENADGSYTITNTLTDTTEAAVTKVWLDNDNAYGTRPESIAVQLLADEVAYGEAVTLDGDNDWTYTWSELPKYDSTGKEITYTTAEIDEIDDYETTYSDDGFTITNTLTGTVDVEGSKEWNDNDDSDGKRPESIKVYLMANNEIVDELEVKPDETTGDWSWSFTDLPKYDSNGVEITYHVVEEANIDYSTEYVKGTYDIINNYTEEQTSVSVVKDWEDSDDQDGKRPESITVKLLADEEDTGMTLELNEENDWTGTFENLDIYHDHGERIAYSVEEADSESLTEAGYTSRVVAIGENSYAFMIINSYTPEETDVTVHKVWQDDNDKAEARPSEVTITLTGTYTIEDESGDEQTVTCSEQTVTIGADDNWTKVFTKLPTHEDGHLITYTVSEAEVDGYLTDVAQAEDGSYVFTVTNTITGETEATVTKEWVDNNNAYNTRPDDISVQLLADGEEYGEAVTLSEENEWTYTWSELPKYDSTGKEITYTTAEIDEVEGYETTYSDDTLTITNALTGTVDIEGEKIWDDADNQDGKRPASITVHLFADGVEIDSITVSGAALDDSNFLAVREPVFLADDTNTWSWSFTDLPKYREGGVEIVYTVTEDVVDEYETTITGSAEEGFTIINSYETEETEATVTKEWVDNDNAYETRPDSITVQLLADEEAYGEAVTLTGENDWTYTWEKLPKYRDGGIEIAYSVEEVSVEGYDSEITSNDDGSFTITNTLTGTVDIDGSKTWVDEEDQDGVRPTSITIRLWADGTTLVGTQVVTPDADGDWTWNFTDLPKYADGVEIVYNVTEDIVTGYDTTYSKNGYDVTNTHTPETIDIDGSKTWDDADNQDGKRPESITIHLLADGEPALDENGDAITATVTKDDDWAWSFTDLPKYRDGGVEIVYTITEDAVDEYETEVNGYDVTNSYTPETVYVEGEKTWDDADNQDGIRPAYITVHLFADGDEVDSMIVVPDSEGSWTWKFTGLPKYKDGTEITYTVTEDAVEGYETSVEGFDVINAHTPETIDIDGSKTWDDADNQDGKRPESITIRLLADGEEIDNVTVTADDDWAWSFTDLDKYAAGKEINYTITEDVVEDYTTTYDGYDVTNSYTPEETSVTVTKAWLGTPTDSVTVTLLADGKDTGKMLTLTAEDGWIGSFTELPVYESGQKIDYTIAEVSVDGYITEITGDATEGYVVTNTELEQFSIGKEVSGDGETTEYEFEVTLKESDGTPFEGDVEATDGDTSWTVTFEDGKATVTVEAGAIVTLTVHYGMDYSVTELTDDADSVVIYVDGVALKKSDTTDAYAAVGTIWDTTEVTFVNSYRAYFPIDEEIVTDEDDIFDKDAWVKNESVNEYNAIEIEMTTTLPVITAYDIENGSFEMNFHEVLDHELILDEDNADFSVYIGQHEISTAYYRITFDEDTGDDCNFHVDVDLTALYNDGIITEEDLQGDTEITIFFFADLEGTDLNGSYKSTIWYDVSDAGEVLYTSNVDVVEVYTYEVEILKYDDRTDDALAGATLGIYYDEDCTEPVYRYVGQGFDESEKQAYTATSGEDGYAMFYGLAEGTYYVTETEAPVGYVLSDEVLTVTLGEELNDSDHTFTGEYANTPETIEVKGSKTWQDDNNADGLRPASITIHLLADGEEVDSKTVTEADGWEWSFTDLVKYDGDKEITYTITEDTVENYTTEVNGYDVTNTYEGTEQTSGKVSVAVTKVWNDEDNIDGIRPASVNVELFKNGESTGRVLVLNEDNNWSGSFDNLDEYTEGVQNVYTVQEQDVEGYTAEITGDVDTGFVVTNTHTHTDTTSGENPPDTGSGNGGGTGTGTTGTGTTGTGTSGTGSSGSGTSSTSGAKTADTDLPILPIAGCCAAIALIAGVLIVRRKKEF